MDFLVTVMEIVYLMTVTRMKWPDLDSRLQQQTCGGAFHDHHDRGHHGHDGCSHNNAIEKKDKPPTTRNIRKEGIE